MAVSEFQQYADLIVGRATAAADAFKAFDQAAVDRVVHAVFKCGYDHRIDFARMAFEETGTGVLEHKVIKNVWASLLVYENIKNQRTVGAISHDPVRGITELAQPHGPILALTPLTNPTSTTIFKCLIGLKTRNPLIFSPHGGARKCSRFSAEILYEAALQAGAPEHCIQWMTKTQIDYLQHIMRHRDLSLILATGTRQVVKEAYGSGKPVIGIGPGNVPAYVDETADLTLAADSIILSKTFDNGTVCASEQSLVVHKAVASELRALLRARGGFFCSNAQARRLGEIAFDSKEFLMRADIVGKPASFLADKAGFAIPAGTKLLVAPCAGVGPKHPLSYEILTPILAYFEVPTCGKALDVCLKLNALGGRGHTVSIYANDDKVVREFASNLSAGRICVNTPATQGAIGGIFNTLTPSFTLSCGTQAGNIFTDNISIAHLINIHRVARRRLNSRWFQIQERTWMDPDVKGEEILALYNRNY
ncbi:MAG: aldehyde dehydrogenase family protein [Candidatus Aminicenantales bacterium]|jgi:acetaldehyde dehydrogenase/alcohol dehydrogenase